MTLSISAGHGISMHEAYQISYLRWSISNDKKWSSPTNAERTLREKVKRPQKQAYFYLFIQVQVVSKSPMVL